MEIIDYEAVSASSTSNLNAKVSELIAKGYQPLGAIAVSIAFDQEDYEKIRLFSQAMVKYNKVKKSTTYIKDNKE